MTIDISTHKNLLIKILKDIYSHADIGPYLGFKGGTAALLFYDLGRFSVDLDFDILDEAKEDIIFNGLHTILKEYGTIKEARKKRFNLFFLLSYKDKIIGAQNIKIDVSRRGLMARYEVEPYLGIPMKVMVQEDMVAYKLVAMHERIGRANRDIFDVWFFLKNNWPINKEIVEKRTKMPFGEFIQRCVTTLEKVSDEGILSGMGELLDAKQKAWAKDHLRAETIFLLKAKLESEK